MLVFCQASSVEKPAETAADNGSPSASDPQQSPLPPQQQQQPDKQQQQPDKQPGSQLQQGEAVKEEAVNARAAALDIVLQKDAFLVFRALCKLTIKSADSGLDVTATRGKVKS